MSWDARQRAMLDAMGLKVWMPLVGAPEAVPMADAEAPAAGAVSGRAAAPAPAEVRERLAGAAARPSAPAGTPVRAAPAPSAAALPARPSSVEANPPSPSPAASTLQSVLPQALAAVDGERARAIAGMTWAQLRESVAACQACGLCEGRKQTVFGVGHEQAHWMIVGEAPGEQEDLQGEPFVGQAGKLLDNMLRALGLTRGEAEAPTQVFIANTLKCRPPRNRNPEPAELAQCMPYLQRQVELVKPRVILALGRFAVQTLLQRSDAIGRLRGQVHAYQGIPVVVSYHPAYLLRNLPDKARAWEDLCLAREVYQRQLAGSGAA